MKQLNFWVVVGACIAVACVRPTAGNEGVRTITEGSMPAICADASGRVYMVYGHGDSIMYSRSTDKGVSFTEPVLIDTLKDLVDYATRGPQIAIANNAVVVIAVDKSGNIHSFVQTSSGKWMPTGRVNDIDTVDKEGFIGLSSDGGNNLFAIWPDLREDGRQKIYGARSTNGGVSWEKNTLVYRSPGGSVCECCKPSVEMKGNNVYVLFRNSMDGNRDLYLIQSADGGGRFGEATKMGVGSWHLDGCPMDGGGLAVGDDGFVQTVWRRENKIFAVAPGTIEKEVGEGRGCSVGIAGGKNVYAWTDSAGNVECLLPEGRKKLLGKGTLPLLEAVDESHVICVWQQDGDIVASVLKT